MFVVGTGLAREGWSTDLFITLIHTTKTSHSWTRLASYHNTSSSRSIAVKSLTFVKLDHIDYRVASVGRDSEVCLWTDLKPLLQLRIRTNFVRMGFHLKWQLIRFNKRYCLVIRKNVKNVKYKIVQDKSNLTRVGNHIPLLPHHWIYFSKWILEMSKNRRREDTIPLSLQEQNTTSPLSTIDFQFSKERQKGTVKNV